MHPSIIAPLDINTLIVRKENSAYCQICPGMKFSRGIPWRTKTHLKSHLRSSVTCRGYLCFGCHLPCRNKTSNHAHYHCPMCARVVSRKSLFQHHITLCEHKPHELQGNVVDSDDTAVECSDNESGSSVCKSTTASRGAGDGTSSSSAMRDGDTADIQNHDNPREESGVREETNPAEEILREHGPEVADVMNKNTNQEEDKQMEANPRIDKTQNNEISRAIDKEREGDPGKGCRENEEIQQVVDKQMEANPRTDKTQNNEINRAIDKESKGDPGKGCRESEEIQQVVDKQMEANPRIDKTQNKEISTAIDKERVGDPGKGCRESEKIQQVVDKQMEANPRTDKAQNKEISRAIDKESKGDPGKGCRESEEIQQVVENVTENSPEVNGSASKDDTQRVEEQTRVDPRTDREDREEASQALVMLRQADCETDQTASKEINEVAGKLPEKSVGIDRGASEDTNQETEKAQQRNEDSGKGSDSNAGVSDKGNGDKHKMHLSIVKPAGVFSVISVIDKKEKKARCRLCPNFKGGKLWQIKRHIKCHVNNSVKCKGYLSLGCHLPCGGRTMSRSHYHCVICSRMIARKNRFISHLESCEGKKENGKSVEGQAQVMLRQADSEIDRRVSKEISEAVRKLLEKRVGIDRGTSEDTNQETEKAQQRNEDSGKGAEVSKEVSQALGKLSNSDAGVSDKGNEMHISIMKPMDVFSLIDRKENKAICRMCPETTFKGGQLWQAKRHIKRHLNNAVKCKGYLSIGCHLPCGGKTLNRAHYHCVICSRMIARKNRYISHLESCEGKKKNGKSAEEQEHNCDEMSQSNDGPLTHAETEVLFRALNGGGTTSALDDGGTLCTFDDTGTIRTLDDGETEEGVKLCKGFPKVSKCMEIVKTARKVRDTALTVGNGISEEVCQDGNDQTVQEFERRVKHISVIKPNDVISLLVSKDKNTFCALCPESKFKGGGGWRAMRHFKTHVRNSVKFKGYLSLGCHLPCRKTEGSHAHYHCSVCGKILSRKLNFIEHLKVCEKLIEIKKQRELAKLTGQGTLMHSRRKAPCHICQKVLVKRNLNRHLKEAHASSQDLAIRKQQARRRCRLCHKVLWKSSMRKHFQLKHPNEDFIAGTPVQDVQILTEGPLIPSDVCEVPMLDETTDLCVLPDTTEICDIPVPTDVCDSPNTIDGGDESPDSPDISDSPGTVDGDDHPLDIPSVSDLPGATDGSDLQQSSERAYHFVLVDPVNGVYRMEKLREGESYPLRVDVKFNKPS
ncbi:uncharacterized protein [Ptychodera flava]|uniref:uncharacterized protein n=1 Tax=Ptychodera flava TaxID=63121 RepID=UPI003969DD77